MKKIAVFPGSFDPITLGHADLVDRASLLFDEVHIAIGINTTKKYLFSLEDRYKWIEELFAQHSNVSVGSFEGLTVNYCQQIGANYILRGLRNGFDYQYEKSIAQLNNNLDANMETVFFSTRAEYGHISSSIVREVLKFGGNPNGLIPAPIIKYFKT